MRLFGNGNWTVRCILQAAQGPVPEVSGDLVALLVFKTSVGLNKVPGGFDSHPPPPISKTEGNGVLKIRVMNRAFHHPMPCFSLQLSPFT